MSELSPQLHELVLAARRANPSTARDADRILIALRSRLGDAAVLGIGSGPARTVGTSTGLANRKQWALAVSGFVLLGGIASISTRIRSAPKLANSLTSDAATSTSKVDQQIATMPVASAETETDTIVPDLAKRSTASTHALASNGSKDSLAEEVSLLAQAEKALGAGNPAQALQVLNLHERKFRHGKLAEERAAARAQALCALGRSREANAQLAQLSEKSMHSERAQQACTLRNKH